MHHEPLPIRSRPAVTLRRRLLLLALAGILPVAVMSAVGLGALFSQQTRLAELTSLEVTRALGNATDSELRLSVAALETLATTAVLGHLEDLAAFDALARRVLVSRPEWRQIVLAEPSGKVVLTTHREAGAVQPASVVEPASLEQLVRTGRPVIGQLARWPQGHWGVPVRVPVFRDGRLRFALTGVLQPEAVREVMLRQRIPPDWVASVFDSTGKRVARSRGHAESIGTPATPSLRRLMQTQGGEHGMGLTQNLEGQTVYTAYAVLPDSRWVVALGIPETEVERGVGHSRWAYGGGVLLSLLVAGVATLLVARRISQPMEQLRLAAEAVGHGTVPAPVHSAIHEIQEVVDTLAAAARARAASEAERERLLEIERAARQAAENAPVRWELLARAGAALSGSLQPQATLEAIARTVVPGIADWCRVDLLDAEGRLQRALTHHADPQKAREAAELIKGLRAAPDAKGSMAWVVATGRSHLARFDVPGEHDPVRDADLLTFARAIGMRSYFIVPLTARGRTFGALAAVQAESGRSFGDEDCALVTELGHRAALALDNARLYATAEAAMVQAESANRAKDEFLAMLGHELRNPLAPITTALQLMERRGDPSTVFERRIIERQVAHMTRLVDDLLDVSRITQGKIELRRERLDLRSAVMRALELTQPLRDARPRPVELDLPAGPVMVSGDAVRLAQVFSNLLMNAAKFTPPEGRIALTMRVQGDSAEVQLTDSGVGMAPELVPLVFEVFVQGPQQLHRGPGGLGLGLAIVKTLVQLHGGSVTAHSEGPGRGSTFTVRLPLAAAPPEAVAAERPRVEAPRSPRRVLVVDDNVDAAETTALLLRELGSQVRTAADGPAALQLLDEFVPEVALLDIGLPGMTGYELARHIRTQPAHAGIVLIAVTGYGATADKARALASGFDALLVKPVEAGQLLATIDSLLAGS